MNELRTRTRTPLAALLSLVVLSVSLAVPLMDVDLFRAGTGVESEHDPAHCVTGHDHTVCQQVLTQQLAPAAPASRLRMPGPNVPVHRTSTAELDATYPFPTPLPRAPPALT